METIRTATATRSHAERPLLAEILHSVDEIRDPRSLASILGHQARVSSLKLWKTGHWQEEEPKRSLEVGNWQTHHGGYLPPFPDKESTDKARSPGLRDRNRRRGSALCRAVSGGRMRLDKISSSAKTILETRYNEVGGNSTMRVR